MFPREKRGYYLRKWRRSGACWRGSRVGERLQSPWRRTETKSITKLTPASLLLARLLVQGQGYKHEHVDFKTFWLQIRSDLAINFVCRSGWSGDQFLPQIRLIWRSILSSDQVDLEINFYFRSDWSGDQFQHDYMWFFRSGWNFTLI